MKVLKRFQALLPAIQEVYQHLLLSPHKNVCFDIDDTLIFDDYRNTPNQQVRALLTYLQSQEYDIHLITARLDDKDMRKQTKDELDAMGLKMRKGHDTLVLCPASCRGNMVTVAQWKCRMRRERGPVALTVGDQWGDLIEITHEDQLDVLDLKHGVKDTPWLVVDPEDGVASIGLKLMA